MSMEKHPLHIKMPDLQKSPEVQKAVEQEERMATLVNEELRESEQEGPLLQEKIPNEPSKRIEAYMDRLENIFLNEDDRIRERNLGMLHDKIYGTLIIKKENFPESYFELQKRIVRERGMGDVEITPEMREQMMDTAIEDQKHSLDAWIDYLTEEDVAYPTWFKYYVWNQITKLSQFDKELGKFKKRTDSTVAPFPDIHRGALAQILDVYEKVKEDNKNLKDPEIQEAFSKKFPTFYAELISKSLAEKIENKENITGEWVKYNKGDNAEADKLFESMQGKGTGWCVEGKETSHKYIKTGDFYVYYTNDAQGKPIQPRLAIQMTSNQIGQIRGILPNQEVESIMQEVLDEKLKEFGQEADSYRKKSEDMKKVTALEHKQEKGEPFTEKDLLFIYEIDSKIEGFGYTKDPRIIKLLKNRNVQEDTSNLSRYILENKESFSKETCERAEGTYRLQEIADSAEITDENLLYIYQVTSRIQALPQDKDSRLNEILKNRDPEKDYATISHYILNSPEKFSDEIKKKAEDTIKAYEIEHKEDLTRDDLLFLHELKSPIKVFNTELSKRISKLKLERDKYKDARILSERINQLVDKVEKSLPFTKQDFEYLFELNGQKIEIYFNIHDNRIGWMRQKANLKDNLHVLFECLPEEIAYTIEQINENTKAWAGDITDKVLEKLPDGITHIHNEFPQAKWRQEDPSYMGPFFDTNFANRLPYERKFVALKKKIENDESLDQDDLLYLYRLDNRASILDHKRELWDFRSKRNPEEDVLTVFNCSKDEVAHNTEEITENTKVYIGKLEPDIFQKLPESVKHIYTDFSHNVENRHKITREKIQVGQETINELLKKIEAAGFKITDDVMSNIKQVSSNFNNSPELSESTFVMVPAGAFGFGYNEFVKYSFSDLYDKVIKSGLKVCSPEAGLTYILQKKPEGEFRVGFNRDPQDRRVLRAYREYRKENYVLGTTFYSPEAEWYKFLFVVNK